MDETYFKFSDAYQYFSFLTDYSVYIFIFSILIFGFLTYFLSIKLNRPSFDSPKIVRKRNKKEKLPKSKNFNKDSVLSLRTEVSDSNKHCLKDEKVVELLSPENEDSEMWIPVVKPKKVSKIEKQSTKTQRGHSDKAPTDRCTVVRVAVTPNTEECSQPEPGVTPPKSDLPLVTKVPMTANKPNTEVTPLKESEKHDDTELPAPRSTESPTNSLTDDFVFIESYKTSSEDGVTVQDDEDDDATEPATSGTSGACRKKNKKQQKVISKQLIEAAIGEGEQKPVGGAPLATGPKKLLGARSSRRPRKDI